MNRFSMSTEMCSGIGYFQSLGLSGYDAAYVTLAKEVKGIWLTFDGKAHKKIASLKLSRCLSL